MIKSLKFLDQILASTPDMVYVYDLVANKNVYANKGIYTMLGYSVEEVQAMGDQLIKELYHPEDLKSYISEHLPKILNLSDDEVYEHVYRVKTKRGNYIWLSSRKKIFERAPDGKPTLMLGYTQNIDQRVRDEEDLRALGRFFEHSGDLFLVVDKHYCIQRGNPALFAILNRTEEQVYGQNFISIIHPDDQPRVAQLMKQADSKTEDTSFHFEVRITSESVINWRTRYDLEKQVCYLVGRDVTGERAAQQEKQSIDKKLEESESHLQLLANNITDLIGLHEPDGKYLYVSSSSKRITGYCAEELVGTNPYAYIHPDDILNIQKNSHELLLQGPSDQPIVIEIEYRSRRKDGEYIWLHTASTTVIENRKVIAITTSTRDITEKKKLQLASEQYQSQLKRSNEELKNFAYIASHDLQEPLRMISSYLQLLETRYKDKLDQDANDFIWYAVDGSERMKRLINALLEYSRVERRFAQQESVDLNEVISIVAQNLSVLIEEHQVTLRCNVLPIIRANDTLMIQLFQNLIGNCIKFRSDRDVIINIDVDENEDFWQFSIKDNGIGIEAKFHDRIFTIFKRLNSKIEGTGIGLAVVKKVIELHNGTVWINSTIDQGATVFFKIPKIPLHDQVKLYSQKEISTPG